MCLYSTWNGSPKIRALMNADLPVMPSLFGEIIHVDGDTYILIHRLAHQPVHNELAELVAIVAVDGIC